MFNRAALLSIQLYAMGQVFAGIALNENRSKEVSRGDSVILTCNISTTNVTQLNWSKDSFLFAYSFVDNQTFSNFTSHTLIDITLPSKLNLYNAQHDDAGLYRCNVTYLNGAGYIVWNVTVYGEPEELDPLWFYLYTLSAVIGLLLCVFTSAVCLYRKHRARTPNQISVEGQMAIQSEEEHDDAGLYRCNFADLNGAGYIVWNVTVYGEPEAICLFRESWTNTSNQESNILSHVQFCLQLGGEVIYFQSLQVSPPPLHSCAVYRANHEQRESVQKLQIQFKAE
ncbi:hypothetical protein NQZ68_004329 [Dissostichus eleginoides]|nr:hypothetical protein NQZ68_004329 [Dissostichus eleginoides]